MSPQMTTLGTIGVGVGSSISYRTKSSGIYRPEDNAVMQNYCYQIDCYENSSITKLLNTTTYAQTYGLHIVDSGTKFYTIRHRSTSVQVHNYDIINPWDLSNISFPSVSTSFFTISTVSNYQTLFRGITASSDLYNFYITEYTLGSTSKIRRYRIKSNRESFAGAFNSTNYELVHTYSIDTQVNSNVYGIKVDPTGSKLYIVNHGSTTSSIQQWSMTNYDLSTLSYQGEISVGSYDISPTDIAFSEDGYNLYFTGLQNARTYQINLSSAWDILGGHTFRTEFLYRGYYTLDDSQPVSLYFKKDGLSFVVLGALLANSPVYPLNYVTSSDSIIKYDLITN